MWKQHQQHYLLSHRCECPVQMHSFSTDVVIVSLLHPPKRQPCSTVQLLDIDVFVHSTISVKKILIYPDLWGFRLSFSEFDENKNTFLFVQLWRNWGVWGEVESEGVQTFTNLSFMPEILGLGKISTVIILHFKFNTHTVVIPHFHLNHLKNLHQISLTAGNQGYSWPSCGLTLCTQYTHKLCL